MSPSTHEFLGIPYPIADGLSDLDSLLDEKINEFVTNLKSGLSETIPIILVQFFDKDPFKARKKSGWFGQSKSHEDLKLWEQWSISVHCELDPGRHSGAKPLAMVEPEDLKVSTASFESNLNKIIEFADLNKHHIPPITSLDSCPFPYTIEVCPIGNMGTITTDPQPQNTDDTWGNYIKNILE